MSWARGLPLQIIDYLLGFFALSAFGMLAFRQVPPTSATWRMAFVVGAGLAVIELVLLFRRTMPTNRLILGANIWLIGGGVAFLSKQWWLLELYEQWGAAGLLGAIGLTGLATTFLSPVGFVAAVGPHRAVRAASLVLLASAFAALGYLVFFANNAQTAAVLPIICLAWLARGLRLWVHRHSMA